jgi:hypothetical protein
MAIKKNDDLAAEERIKTVIRKLIDKPNKKRHRRGGDTRWTAHGSRGDALQESGTKKSATPKTPCPTISVSKPPCSPAIPYPPPKYGKDS